ncbi:MAG: hypothetical protein BM564_00790 [Bacteroidetes bacterium MedPE-SWsnd-G2]|nr:MAG: hypothetical protein BM564_00790 [Bacteroidetes bacterium MedPE-SWsnd-G2]
MSKVAKIKTATIKNANGMTLTVLNYGASIIALNVPNKNRNLTNVVLGFPNVEDYVNQAPEIQCLNLGASIGRYAGRISKGGFTIRGTFYPISHVNGLHLHGGEKGFGKQFWNIDKVDHDDNPQVVLSYTSKHLEEGYPGTVKITVNYTLTSDNQLKVSYEATTNLATIINITNHSYFNLNETNTILGQTLNVASDHHLEVDHQLLPTGNIKPSKDSKFDLNKGLVLSKSNFDGFDDTFVLNSSCSPSIKISSKETGISMTVKTNQPAVVVFTPKQLPIFLATPNTNKEDYPAICFETQNFPDAPNHKHFPQAVLTPGERYINETIFSFSVES